ncbi:MAG: AAA family ATPase [Gammaproteobacteria bacterium]|nr:AAA family ATPase [Gammaproteobacteria bacterium]MDE2262288.1 AAA family ATPase [Gammaproteobacteria bacterium]
MSIIESAIDKIRRATPAASAAAGTPAPVGSHGGPEGGRDGVTPIAAHRRIHIDLSLLRAQGEMPEAGQERRFADYYREIKRPLIQKALAAEARPESRLILISSALPAEGKTFTAINLALSIARERDVSVLLVDGDFPKGHLSRAFGIQDERGLLDAVADEALDVESLVLGTDLKGLELLPAGRAAEGAASELITSARMAQVAARLTARHPRRLVLFDSSPLLVSSEARALKQIPGQILIVTRAGRTPRQALLDAIALIDKTKLHGLVLNDAHVASGDGYSDYYGYGAAGGQTPGPG